MNRKKNKDRSKEKSIYIPLNVKDELNGLAGYEKRSLVGQVSFMIAERKKALGI